MASKALISGSSGLVGQELCKLLLESDSFDKVYCLVRNPSKQQHPKLEEILFNYDEPSSYQSLPEVDHVFCCLGTTIKKAGSKEAFKKVDYHYPLQVATHTLTNGALAFHVITALGANASSPVFYNKVKGELEDALKKLNFTQLFIYQPSLLIGDRKENRFGEKIASAIFPTFEFLLVGGLKKYRSIKVEAVAKGMLYTAIHNKKTFKTIVSDEIQDLATHHTAL